MITIHIENENPFNAGWLACHLGLPKDCLPELTGMDRESFDDGYQMRAETADMQTPDAKGHGDCHIAFLVESERPIGFVRHKVSATKAP